MTVSMKDASKIIAFFMREQRARGYEEEGNVVQLKWDLRDIANHIDNNTDLRQLILFFLLTSDDKSMSYFVKVYDKYYETMIEVREDRIHRMWLQAETLRKEVEAEKKKKEAVDES